jgi:hypothetical protein
MITPQMKLELSPEPLAQRAKPQAGAKKNGGFGWKPMVTYEDGSTSFPCGRHCQSREAAEAVARAWIAAGRV